jgi:hypothetical protein
MQLAPLHDGAPGAPVRELPQDHRERQPVVRLHAVSRAVQVDPIKPKLKPPGTKRLKLEHDVPLSNFAFKFNLRRYTSAQGTVFELCQECYDVESALPAGAYSRSRQSST